MTVSPRTSRKGRRFLWLAVFRRVLFVVYSAGWFYFANRVRAEAGKTIAALNAKGVDGRLRQSGRQRLSDALRRLLRRHRL